MCDKQSYREMGYKPRKPEELPEEKKEEKKKTPSFSLPQEQYHSVSRAEWERMQANALPISEFFARQKIKKRHSTGAEFKEQYIR